MMTLRSLALFALLYCQVIQAESRTVCYYANWSGKRNGDSKFSIEKIDPFLCTHIVYAFVRINDTTYSLQSLDPQEDFALGGFRKMNDLKKRNPGLNTQVSVGGWQEGSETFSKVTSSLTARVELAKNIVSFLRYNNFNGVDLCWQYPGSRVGASLKDKENYALLLKDLRNAIAEDALTTNQTPLLLSVVVSGLGDIISDGFDISALNSYVDYVNLISYDYYMAFGTEAQHHSKLYPSLEDLESPFDSLLNADTSVRTLLSKGLKSNKINLGIPTYGRLSKLEDTNQTAPGSALQGNGQGNSSNEAGYAPYLEICNNIIHDQWTVGHQNSTAMGPYAFKGELWVSYDDEISSKMKGRYAKKSRLGGIMFWTLDHDDFDGSCSGVKFPLVRSGADGFYNTSEYLSISQHNKAPKMT